MDWGGIVTVNFSHVHLHTPQGSLLDGFCRIDPMIKLAKEFGMDSIGVSDHGTCFAHIEFYKKCKEAGIHPVLGMEGYITPKKQWKKADFDKINFTDLAYRTKDELAALESQGYSALEKKEKDSFTKGKQTKPEHVEFLAKLEQSDPDGFAKIKKSFRWYLSGKQDDRQKNLFEWSPRIAHLLMIAKTNEGYKNLLKLTTIGSLEGFYGKPRFDYGDIKKYGKGLIATSSCLGGTIPQLIKKGRLRVAKNHIKFYQKCFDEFYLEIQPSTMDDQQYVNNVLIQWAEELNVPLVATSDAHMLRPEENAFHKAMTSIGKGKEDDSSDIDFYEHCVFYSAQEMLDLGMPEEAMENAYKIAHSCHVDLDESEMKFPVYEVPENHTFDSYLRELSEHGLMTRLMEGNFEGQNFFKLYHKYRKRLDYELSVMSLKKLSAYYIIVWDFVNYAKSRGILTGPGRGSGAGSLVLYCLGITNLDPIKYDLLFERMLNPERPGAPDVDQDFDYLRRHEVIEYVTNKYGADYVAQIATFGTLSTKSALKDIGRVLGIDHNEINEMNKHIPVVQGKVMKISDALVEIKEVKAYQERYPRLFELALEVESMPRNQGIHACGVLISPVPIVDEVALVRGKAGERVTSYDGPTLESKGFIKFDFLGLKNLSVIELCRRLVEQRHGFLIDVDNLEPDDKTTFAMLQRGETDGVFQVESDGMKKMFMGMNQVDFDDVIAGLALYRPGPMAHIPTYLARKNGTEEVEYPHEVISNIAGKTFGLLVYQEQIMRLTGTLGGYSLLDQDNFRKAIGKKSQEVMDKNLPPLRESILKNGYSEEVADWCIENIKPFVGYGFNKSHAAAYALISYQTAYLKANYPIEYMTALLQVFYDEEAKVIKYAKVARDMGIAVLPPDINTSEVGFTIDGENNAIRFGLGSLNGLGEATLEAILAERQVRDVPVIQDEDGGTMILTNEEALELMQEDDEAVIGLMTVGGPYQSAQDLLDRIPRKNFNKTTISALSYAGAFDSLYDDTFSNRFEFLAYFLSLRGEAPDADLIESIAKYTDRLKFEKERQILGMYVSGHVLDRLAEPTDWDGLDDSVHYTMVSVVEPRVIRTKKGDNMAFLKVDTLEGERSLTLFPQQYEGISEALVPGMILKVGVRMSMNWQRNQKDFIISSISAPKKINKEVWKKIEAASNHEGGAA